MNKNVGTIDRVLRIVAGVVLLGYALIGPETGYNAWGYIGILPLATALFRWCPAYTLFGIRTGPASPKSD